MRKVTSYQYNVKSDKQRVASKIFFFFNSVSRFQSFVVAFHSLLTIRMVYIFKRH